MTDGLTKSSRKDEKKSAPTDLTLCEQKDLTLSDLVDRDLAGWKIETMFEVYDTNGEGAHSTVGYFRDEKVAQAVVEQPGKDWGRGYTSALVLTFGSDLGFAIDDVDAVNIYDDEIERQSIVESILDRLQPHERALIQSELAG